MKTVRSIRGLALTGVAALGLIAMTPALADSQFNVGGSGTQAQANLDFQVIIPTFVFLQIGDDTDVNIVTFDAEPQTVDQNFLGSGTAVNGVSDGANPIPVTLIANVGSVNFGAASVGNLESLAGDTIAWTQISGSATTGTAGGGLSVPTIDGGTVAVGANVGGIINRNDTWSFTYANDNVVPAGTYEGRVVYTATAP